MDTNRRHFARPALAGLGALAACVALIVAPMAVAQAPAASGNAAEAPSAEELEKLVGPIALYPDDLVTVILPASTNPLQIVQADRYLQKRKQDPKAPLDDSWDDSVKTLLNYPEVVKQMSNDLDWTAELGEAVVADQAAVFDAVQAFRRKAQSAGNLKTDEKQVIVVEKEVIKIEPADPQVIYVPQYNPTTVVAYSSVPVYGYYPAPYPSYYYPYAPGAALATGLIWGAAIGAAWGGGRYGWGGGGDININRNTNINTGDRGSGNRAQQRPSQGGGQAWKSDKKPGQVKSGAGRASQTSARAGDARPGGGGGGAGARPGGGAASAGARPSAQSAGGGVGQGGARSQPGAGGGAGGGRDAFGGYGSGSGARADSSRGASSRSSMSSGGGGRSSAGASSRGGGGGGGGGARGGGGGGRGGGGRR
ncbi:MAG TPA: DUF3300 domain-containing protein [Casimicrobiaceae bacterium]|jgi:hypothetical protein